MSIFIADIVIMWYSLLVFPGYSGFIHISTVCCPK